MNSNAAAPLAHPVNIAAARMGIGRVKLYELIGSGEIHTFTIGSKRLVPEAEFRVMHGFGSATSLYEAAQSTLSDKRTTVIYVGDRDPSGCYMSEVDILARMDRYGALALDRGEQARALLSRDGLVQPDRFGQPKPHPGCVIVRDAESSFRSALRDLRLDVEPARPVGRPPGV